MAKATPWRRVEKSGSREIDGLLFEQAWRDAAGTTTLTFSFPGNGASWAQGYREPRNDFQRLTDTQRDAVREAFGRWEDLADLRFSEVADGTGVTIRFGRTSATGVAHAYLPGGNPEAGDVWLGPRFDNSVDYGPGSYAFFVLLHEIGHAIGLKHPHEPEGINVVLPPKQDWIGSSVMSYRTLPGEPISAGGYSAKIFPDAPTLHDVAAIQYLYGANPTTNAGNTSYGFDDAPRPLRTIYDAGGNDTIDASAVTRKAVIDLEPGSFSAIGAPFEARGKSYPLNLSIAANTWIENAIGGAGHDVIRGNRLDNRLEGGPGKDKLFGGAGDDILIGGPGNDRLDGGPGNDTALYDAPLAFFEISIKGKGARVQDVRADGLGRDKLKSIEILDFSDQVIPIGGGAGAAKAAVAAALADYRPDLDTLVSAG